MAFDITDSNITDSDDPDFGKKIAALQARNHQEHPELAGLVAKVPSFAVPASPDGQQLSRSI